MNFRSQITFYILLSYLSWSFMLHHASSSANIMKYHHSIWFNLHLFRTSQGPQRVPPGGPRNSQGLAVHWQFHFLHRHRILGRIQGQCRSGGRWDLGGHLGRLDESSWASWLNGFSWVFLWCSWVFLWFSWVFLWYGFFYDFHGCFYDMGFSMMFMGFSMIWVFLWCSWVFLWCSWVFLWFSWVFLWYGFFYDFHGFF